jgi:hypothetical protein
VSFCRKLLYRKRLAAVILAAVAAFAALWPAARASRAQELVQENRRRQEEMGPRAVGIIQITSTGKARVIPITIMMGGKFYDASSFKATPVPMALDFGVVYEGFRTGVSQGLFTVTQPGQLNHNWIAEGTWLPAGVKPPEKTKKYAAPVIDDGGKNNDDRPVLHRRAEGAADKDEPKPAAAPTTASQDSAPAKPSSTPAANTSAPTGSAPAGSPSSTGSSVPPGTSTSGSPSSTAPSSTASGSPSGTNPSSNPSSSSSPSTSSSSDSKDSAAKDAGKTDAGKKDPNAPVLTRRASSDDEPIDDPHRPRLRRGKPDPNAHREPFVDFDTVDNAPATAGSATAGSAATTPNTPAPVLTFAAVSDAAGPDPRPYTYDLKPAEEAIYRNKMTDLAATSKLTFALLNIKMGASLERMKRNSQSACGC